VLTVASIYGVVDHIAVNYNSGPLGYRFRRLVADAPVDPTGMG
jgi:hypothetical protein